ncbi:MAG: hypothetical protein ABIK68_01965 [bacterium]
MMFYAETCFVERKTSNRPISDKMVLLPAICLFVGYSAILNRGKRERRICLRLTWEKATGCDPFDLKCMGQNSTVLSRSAFILQNIPFFRVMDRWAHLAENRKNIDASAKYKADRAPPCL